MDTLRSTNAYCRNPLGVASAVMGLALLVACGTPRAAMADADSAAIPTQKIDSICNIELGFDVTGPYYQSCRNYLRRHFQAEAVAVHLNEPAEHRACEQIGLARDTLDYRKCVQELYQLDVSNDHL